MLNRVGGAADSLQDRVQVCCLTSMIVMLAEAA
jgi:hypothetical protein